MNSLGSGNQTNSQQPAPAPSRPEASTHDLASRLRAEIESTPSLRFPRLGGTPVGIPRSLGFGLLSGAGVREGKAIEAAQRSRPFAVSGSRMTDPLVSARSPCDAPVRFVSGRLAPLAFAGQCSFKTATAERAGYPCPRRTTQFSMAPRTRAYETARILRGVAGCHRSYSLPAVPLHIQSVLAPRPRARARGGRKTKPRHRGAQAVAQDVDITRTLGFREQLRRAS